MQRKAAGSFCECRQGDLCFAQTHRHELYLCDFIERRKGREERVAQPRNAKKSRGEFLRVPTGGFVLCTNPPARAVRSRQKLVQHGDPAKCRRNIVGNKPRGVFASADRGICALHKPTGTSCIYVILLQPHTGAENAKISFDNRLTRVKRGYIIQSVESEISFFSVVEFAYANRCERESGNQSVSTVAKRHLFLRK